MFKLFKEMYNNMSMVWTVKSSDQRMNHNREIPYIISLDYGLNCLKFWIVNRELI